MKNVMIKVDMHIHTSCSPDSLILIDNLLESCDYKGIDCVAVTDHDTAEGALRLHEIAPSRIIVGEEIHTTSGEIIGLFLKETIRPWLSTMETIERIKDQGGLVFLPHPFDSLRGAVLDKHIRNEIYESIDIVEVYNSRNVFPWTNWKAAKFAAEKGILGGAGSDAHSRFELGRAHVVIEPFDSADDFLLKLANAEIRGRKTPVILNFVSKIYKTIRGIG
jgi:predicted metal-dependent phosphoesterase TrpH